MKTRNLALAVLGSMLLVGGVWAQSGKSAAVEQAVAALEQKWLQSQRTNNPELLASLLADDVMDTGSDGKLIVGKAAVIADAKSTKWSSVDYSGLKVTVHGDTAIATGIMTGKGTAAGKPLDSHDAFTDTWVKMPGGQWRCVATHSSTIKM